MPRSRAAAPYDRKSSVTKRSGAKAYFFKKLAHQFQSGVLVALGLDQHIEDLALGVDGAPKINHSPIDFQIDFVEMPPNAVYPSCANAASIFCSSFSAP